MKKLVLGCAVAGLIALSPKSDARTPALPGTAPKVANASEVGYASWYGIERQGKPTASGEPFDQNKLTAAHRRLPFGTLVRVTNLRNFASALIRINDRGPGVGSRVIDVSWAAAKQLGFLEAGLARVEISIISSPNRCIGQIIDSQSPKLN